jgi:DNA-binding MarR family transcriptional regulator
MNKNGSTGSPRRAERASGANKGQTLDLERYVPAFVTFIANKLSRSATAFYQKRFGVNVTEWRIMSLLAIEPGIPASRICHVIGFDKGPVSRTLTMMQNRDLIASGRPERRPQPLIMTAKGRATHDRSSCAPRSRAPLLSCLNRDSRKF